METSEKLKEILETGSNWQRTETSETGIFVVKMPARGQRPPSLAVELNPVGRKGMPEKKRGYFIRSNKELEELLSIVNNPKLREVLRIIEELGPQEVVQEEILEI